jgi:hypothetical protein
MAKVQLPLLSTGPLPLLAIREQARRAVLDVLDSVGSLHGSGQANPLLSMKHALQRRGGKKALFLDQHASSCLSCLDMRLSELLAEHGVARCAAVMSSRAAALEQLHFTS